MGVARSRAEGLRAVEGLAGDFGAGLDVYQAPDFNETANRNQFIDPLFEALGWDVGDRQRWGRRREVVVENRQTTTATVAGEDDWDLDLTDEEFDARAVTNSYPDYIFRVDAVDRFVAEAKKPAVNLQGRGPAFQAKSYAWSKGLPIAVLTDFEEFRLFDARLRPEFERPRAGVVPGFDLRFDSYPDRWDDLWDLLSREAVVGGSLEQFIADKPVRGAQPVDRAFLTELAAWRMRIATDLKQRNSDLTGHELAEATQRILDRVVFIRVMEDRGILEQLVLRRHARTTDAYRSLRSAFRNLDAVYNGQLFSEHFSERLDMSDAVLQELVASLYYPGPYRFNVIGTDLLGSIYEQFLGQTVTLDVHGRASVEDKPEIRHAGGVYYTPRWIVSTIVDRTLGPLLRGKTPRQVANIRILDPACGSGAFLLGAFEYLVRWHEDYYENHPTESPQSHFLTSAGERRVTSDAKATILANNIYGVDIDPQAVEVTQMSLYLSMLEHESHGTLNAQRRLFESAFLPRLDRNIRNGNSLLSPDDVDLGRLFSDEELGRRVNPFDWRDEVDGFGEVFQERGGFDVIIGNPPYTRIQVLRDSRPDEADVYQRIYASAAEGSFDIASLFVEQGLSLLRSDGVLGFIITRGFCETDAGRPLRRLLSEGRHVSSIVDFGSGLVFEGVSAYTLLLFAGARSSRHLTLTRVPSPPSPATLAAAEAPGRELSARVRAQTLSSEEWDLAMPAESALLDRLAATHPTLGDACGSVIFQGVVTGADYIFRLTDVGAAADGLRVCRHRSTGEEVVIEEHLLRPVLAGRSDIHRFVTAPPSEWLLLPYARAESQDRFRLLRRDELAQSYPLAWSWLETHEEELRRRAGQWTADNYWGYSRRQNLELFEEPKILVPYMIDHLCATLENSNVYLVNVSTGGYGIPTSNLASPHFVTALLNSRLLSWVLRRYSRAFRGDWFAARKENLARLPLVSADAEAMNDVVDSYARCLQSRFALGLARSDSDADRLRRAHRAFVASYDAAVEDLYELTALERAVVAATT
jgi:type I restriction-modification system DNA methylase subunit